MTRFARAHGSKASNERQPEEATSWNVLKQQLLEQQALSEKKEEEVLKPAKQPFVFQTDKSKTTEWAEFEETSNPKHKKLLKKEKREEKLEDRPTSSCEEQSTSKTKLHKTKNCNDVNTKKKLAKKLKKMKGNGLNSDVIEDLSTVVIKDEVQAGGGERQLSKRQLKRLKQLQKKKQDDGFVLKRPKVKESNKPIPDQAEASINANGVNEVKPKLPKRQKDKGKLQLKKQQSSTSMNTPTHVENVTTDGQSQTATKFQAQSKRQKRNLKKLGDPTKVKHKRRKPYLQTTTMVINGQEIGVTMLDGFPVRKDDADRLMELRKQMVDNGIPHTEIDETMKLERRKAEKALARERRKVCFHCRKGGHNLSECPELYEGSNQDAAGCGICFKCGSTEHTHFECRVVRGQEFRFAKCFICQEQGHISRQCPDNPRGLYPKGGGCKVCGDVTHLKKDCPDLHEKKEQNVITLDMARSDQLEALDEDLRVEDSRPVVEVRKKKIIKF